MYIHIHVQIYIDMYIYIHVQIYMSFTLSYLQRKFEYSRLSTFLGPNGITLNSGLIGPNHTFILCTYIYIFI